MENSTPSADSPRGSKGTLFNEELVNEPTSLARDPRERVGARNAERSTLIEERKKNVGKSGRQRSTRDSSRNVEPLSSVETRLRSLTTSNSSQDHSKALSDVRSDLDPTTIQRLSLKFSELTVLPSFVSNLTSLRSLDLSNNRIEELPASLGELSALEELILASNDLTSLPDSLASLENLTTLDLRGNWFKEIPECLVRGARKLKHLNLSRNIGCDLHNEPSCRNLKAFGASDNGPCSWFPRWLLSSKFTELESVVLDGTTFESFESLDSPNCSKSSEEPVSNSCEERASSLSSLSVQQCGLSVESFASIARLLPRLRKLFIGNSNAARDRNAFWFLPAFDKPASGFLEELSVRCAGLPSIPATVNLFANLRLVDVGFNDIHRLPDELCDLRSLQRLIVEGNKISALPERIGELDSLVELRASRNCLCSVPESTRSMASLRFLDLYDNEVRNARDVLRRLPPLDGLDLERNYFDAEEIEEIDRYNDWKRNLRLHWPEDFKNDGRKSETPSDEVYSRVSLSSSEESGDYSILSVESCGDPFAENWDLSDDSSSEFDPNEVREPKKRVYSPLAFYAHGVRRFCPADSHQRRTNEVVRQMILEGSLQWPAKCEEGQFEDP